MSEMEVFIGTFKETERKDVKCVDDDDFYDLEEKHQCHFVLVDGKVYEFHATIEVDPHGFSIVVPASKDNLLFLYWYNGGAGVHEVAEDAIRKHLAARSEAENRRLDVEILALEIRLEDLSKLRWKIR